MQPFFLDAEETNYVNIQRQISTIFDVISNHDNMSPISMMIHDNLCKLFFPMVQKLNGNTQFIFRIRKSLKT